MNYKDKLGGRGEELAAEYLTKAGYRILERNFRLSHDEIDIIAENDKYIIFVEVKTRAQTESNMRYGRPGTAVNYAKKQKLLRSAIAYLREYKPKKAPRIDVIEVYMPAVYENSFVDTATLMPTQINHIKNAVHR